MPSSALRARHQSEPQLFAKQSDSASAYVPLLGLRSPDPHLQRAREFHQRSMGQLDAEDQIYAAKEKKKKSGYAWWQWALLISFGITFGLANGADNAASTFRALPVMVHLSTGWLQFAMSSLSFLGALMNFFVIMMSFPSILKFLKHQFRTGGINRKGAIWELPIKRRIGVAVGLLFTLATSVGIAFFTYNSVPTVIVGIAAVFGATVASGGGAILAIAAGLAVLQGIAMFLMLFKDTVNIISTASIKGLRSFLMIGEFKPKTRQDHYKRAGRLLMSVLGVAVMLLAGAFMIFGQGSAVSATVKSWGWSTAASNVFTGIFVYCIASMSHFALRLASANGVFAKFGDWIGKKVGYVFSNQAEKEQIDHLQSLKKEVKVKKSWSEKTPPEKIQTVLKVLWPITLLALLGNTIGNAFSGMRGDHLLHQGTTTDGSEFHHQADMIAQNPAYVHDAVAVGAGAPEIASAAINGAASATLVTYFVFGSDLNDEEPSDAKQAVGSKSPSKHPVKKSVIASRYGLFKRETRFSHMMHDAHLRANYGLESPSYLKSPGAASAA